MAVKETKDLHSSHPIFNNNQYRLIFVSVLAFLAYVPTWIWMWDRWFARDSYYSHGILVPLVTAYLIWMRKKKLLHIKVKRSSWGIICVGVGVLLYLLSSVFRVYSPSAFSVLFIVIGLTLHYYGWQVLRIVLFPLLFLGFMIPLPLVFIVNISFQMKLFAAKLATHILNSMGLFAIREGSIIIMRHTHVVVDDICSGLRSLIALMALGSIFAYWLRGKFWKRILLFLMTAPIAIVTNVCRIVFLASVSEIWGPKYASGFLHDLSGFLIFALAFIMLYGISQVLED